jgi:hypothetical protein
MDFSKFDTRARAEVGVAMQIMDSITGDPIMDGDKPCRVILRGVASRSIQEQQRARLTAAAQKQTEDGEVSVRVMEDIHAELCEAAAPFILGFENVARPEDGGRPLTAEDAMWFLDLTFPEMGPKLDSQGEMVMRDGVDKHGKPEQTPVFEMKNNPFAKQIAEFTAKQANFLGNASAS